MGCWLDAEAVCPFFRKNDPNRIRCEGLEKHSTINLVFEDTKKQKEYLREHCCDIEGYKRCHICEMLLKKYEVDKQ